MNIIWLFGRSGAGKSTIGSHLEKQFLLFGATCKRFDGDELRKTINKDLGFSKAERLVAVERAIEHILTVNSCDYKIVSMITPYHRSQLLIKECLEDQVLLSFLCCSVETCAKRDQKGLYAKNPNGLLDFETPVVHDLSIDSERNSVQACSNMVIQVLLGLETKVE
jgi:adenylylsulfate kinase